VVLVQVKVRAQSMPAAGGARREDGRITAAAPDVENILSILDPRAGKATAPSAGPASGHAAHAAR
jgi:hypothetical protein